MGWVPLVVALAAMLAVALVAGTLANRRLRRRADRAVGELEDLKREFDSLSNTALHDRAVQALILKSMREGILLLGSDKSTAFVNEALVDHLGGKPDGLHALAPLALREAAERTILDGRPRSAVFELSVPARWLSAAIVPAGEEGAVLVVVTDVTESRRLEATRRDFVANASHELKTPAASIRAAAETILHVPRDDPSSVPRFARQLEREAVRLSHIVEDLLDLSRLESGSELTERVSIDALAREAVERFAHRAGEAGISLAARADGSCVVRGSAKDLSLLVDNLLDNAIRHTGPDGSVVLSVHSEPDVVRLEVSDTGIGIPTKDLPRVFERFYRVDQARSRDTGGTGLGLSIVKHVAENHGGSVEVRSELAAGTAFIVRLPAIAD